MESHEITQLLIRYRQGDAKAVDHLLPAVYQELKKLARSYMARENSGHTLQATALVHEAYVKLIDQKQTDWQNRAHFFGVAAQIMRRILIDHARARSAQKRGGNDVRVVFDEALPVASGRSQETELLALDTALQRLTELDERQGRVVELRYFGGLGIEETAEVMQTSPATVKRDWTLAKAWLYRELKAS